jgi:hypothetical protein
MIRFVVAVQVGIPDRGRNKVANVHSATGKTAVSIIEHKRIKRERLIERAIVIAAPMCGMSK